jgi:hypothetical protein
MKAASTGSSLRARGVAQAGTRGTEQELCDVGAGCRFIANSVNGMCGFGQHIRQ